MAYPEKAQTVGLAATGAVQQKTGTSAPTAGPNMDMTDKASREILAEYAGMVQRRDSHLAAVKHDARPTSSEVHVDAATWEEWLDGNLSDEYIGEQLRNHPCELCRSNYEHYKAFKKKS